MCFDLHLSCLVGGFLPMATTSNVVKAPGIVPHIVAHRTAEHNILRQVSCKHQVTITRILLPGVPGPAGPYRTPVLGKEDRYERNPSGVSFVFNHKFFRALTAWKNLRQRAIGIWCASAPGGPSVRRGLTRMFPFSIPEGADDSVRPFLRQTCRVPAFTHLSACSAGHPAKQAPCPAFGAGLAGTCRSTGSRRPHGPPAGCPRPLRPSDRTAAPGSSG